MRAFIDFPDPSIAHDAGSQSARWQAGFEDPLQILTAWRLDEVPALLQQVQAHARAGRWCVGEVAYEAAAAFDAALVTQKPRPAWPLARFAVFERMLAGLPAQAGGEVRAGEAASGAVGHDMRRAAVGAWRCPTTSPA